MSKDLNLTDRGTKIEGFVEIELESKKTGKRKFHKFNTVTNIGKLLFMATGPSLHLLHPTQIDRGLLHLSAPLAYPDSRYTMRIGNIDSAWTLYLINSDEELTVDSKFLPLYTPNLQIDPNKLVGYASFRRTPTTAKEGVIDRVKGSHLVDDFVQIQRYKFDTTQANGTFNKVCFGLGVITNPGNGFSLSKGIFPTDISPFGGIDSLENAYMRPGVTGFTADNEILVSTAAKSTTPTANAVFNLETGEFTLLDTTDPRYGAPLGDANIPQVFYGNHLYFIRSGSLYRFDVTNKSVSSALASDLYGVLFAEGDKLFYYRSGQYIDCYNMTTLSNESASRIYLGSQTFTTNFFYDTSPSYVMRNAIVGRDSDGNYMIVPGGGLYGPRRSFVCSDIRNIEATVLRYRPGARSASEYLVNGVKYNIWADIWSVMGYTQISGFSEVAGNRAAGLKFSKDWMGNLVSFVNLANPITKTDQDVLYISYGYRYL